MFATLLVAVLTAAPSAIVTKWVGAGGRAQRWRTRLRQELELLEALRQIRPANSGAISTLEAQVDERAADYLRFTGSRNERVEGRWSFGVAALSLTAVFVALVVTDAVPSDGPWVVVVAGLLGVVGGVLAIVIEPVVRAVRRSSGRWS